MRGVCALSGKHCASAALLLQLVMTAPAGSAGMVEWPKHLEGPRSSASVYWVGHSLIETKAPSESGPIDLMSLLGTFARAKGLHYAMGDHTLWGSPLSALWRGQPHGYERDASSMVEKRISFQAEAAKYDSLVITEIIPVRKSITHEFSAYYVRRFYCAIKTANPAARVYLYETWAPINGLEAQPGNLAGWRETMRQERSAWEELADLARKPGVTQPSWRSSFWPAGSDAGCSLTDPIFIVPVGSAMVKLADRLERPRPTDRFDLPDGGRLTIEDLFANPFVRTPPGSAHSGAAEALLREPGKPHDDIHPSGIGVHFAALVHFATIYRQSPAGLPAPASLGGETGRTLASIAWETVVSDPRAGVAPGGVC